MDSNTIPFDSFVTGSNFFTPMPGPDRKRSIRPYLFRVVYRNPEPREPGCALSCEVFGGRLSYKVDLERRENGRLRWHCTCADGIYRAENQGRYCKHVNAILAICRHRQDVCCEVVAKAG